MVWKQLIGIPVDIRDLEAIDLDAYEDITELMECHLAPTSIGTEEAFASAFGSRAFTCIRSDGTEVELVLGGRTIPVTFANRQRFCALLLQYRLQVRARVCELRVCPCA